MKENSCCEKCVHTSIGSYGTRCSDNYCPCHTKASEGQLTKRVNALFNLYAEQEKENERIKIAILRLAGYCEYEEWQELRDKIHQVLKS
jgi:hypothetical protein